MIKFRKLYLYIKQKQMFLLICKLLDIEHVQVDAFKTRANL